MQTLIDNTSFFTIMSTFIHLISTLAILLFILMYVLRETLFTEAPGYNKSFNFKTDFFFQNVFIEINWTTTNKFSITIKLLKWNVQILKNVKYILNKNILVYEWFYVNDILFFKLKNVHLIFRNICHTYENICSPFI